MKKILVIPNKSNIDKILETNIYGILLPIMDLSCEYEDYFTIEEINNFLNKTNKKVSVIINKIMHNKDLKLLESTLIELNKLNIDKILFYDLSILNISKRLKLNKDLVIYQDHLNASTYSNNFYKKRGINYTVITNDITIDEINNIARNMEVMLICYGYVPIFYSRRYIVTNYFKYISKDKEKNLYYIRNNDKLYPIKEEDYGTCIYTDKPINLINEIDNINLSYIIINTFNTSNDTILSVIDDYINNRKNNDDNYLGFLHKKTVYKVVDYDK